MNQIVNLNSASTLVMSSREIADLTGKRHDHVMADVSKMLREIDRDIPNFRGIYLDSMNRKQKEYLLPKRETLILVSGYSVVLRTRIIDRWMELEAQAAPQPVASVPPALARVLPFQNLNGMAQFISTLISPLPEWSPKK